MNEVSRTPASTPATRSQGSYSTPSRSESSVRTEPVSRSTSEARSSSSSSRSGSESKSSKSESSSESSKRDKRGR
jgi:hypothetical protein